VTSNRESVYRHPEANRQLGFYFIVFALFISGCVPFAAHYFEPNGLGITARSTLCNGNVGFPDHAWLSLGNHQVYVSVTRDPHRILNQRKGTEQSVFITLSFNLKPGQSVSFDPLTMQLTDKLRNKLQLIRNPYVVVWDGPHPPDPSSKEITKRFSYSNTNIRKFEDLSVSFYFEFNANKLNEFNLNSSSVILSGTEYKIPDISFKEKFSTTILPLNC